MNLFQKILYQLAQFLLKISSPARSETKGELPEKRMESLKNAIESTEADLEETEKKSWEFMLFICALRVWSMAL